MSEIQGSGPLSPQQLAANKNELIRGSQLFKKAMQEYSTTKEIHKKSQLQKVMNESLHAINQIINNVLQEEGKKIKDKTKDDYQSFASNPSSDNMNNLNNDIDNINIAI